MAETLGQRSHAETQTPCNSLFVGAHISAVIPATYHGSPSQVPMRLPGQLPEWYTYSSIR